MNFSSFFNAVKTDAVVITVNQRLARHLNEKIEQVYVGEGCTVWPSPTILSFDAWVLSIWQSRFNTDTPAVSKLIKKTLLTPDQTLIIWQQLISQSSHSTLLNVAATAKAASKARQLALQWGITDFDDTEVSFDIEVFNEWHDTFKKTLEQHAWVDQAGLPSIVDQLIKTGQCFAETVVLAGFDVYTCQQDMLWSTLKQQGCLIDSYTPYTVDATVNKLAAEDSQVEAQTIAQWAREQLEETPDKQIGIIMPDLQMRQVELEAAFKQAFYPNHLYPVDVPINKPYNVSLGLALSTYPPIQQLLRLLGFLTKCVNLSDLNKTLRSPFIAGGQAEWGQRARLEKYFRDRGYLTVSFKQVCSALSSADDKDYSCPSLSAALIEVQTVVKTLPNRANAIEWLPYIRLLLNAIGCRGDRELGSLEYQVFQAWEQVLKTFISVNDIKGKMSLESAVSTLKQLANTRIFQPETPPAPIQIMGLMESAGHTFDALWVAGLHDKCWPPTLKANPFLPINQQRQQGLVQASASLQYQLARLQTEQWSKSAKAVIFSYPSTVEGNPMLESPLLRAFNEVNLSSVVKAIPSSELKHRLADSQLGFIRDDSVIPINREGVSRGGVSIIKDQAACPFKAYAHKRLMVSALEQPEPGIDARLRGSLVHRGLEMLWLTIKTQQNLLSLSMQERDDLVTTVVADVIHEQARFTPILKTTFGQMEGRRIAQLLLDWLELDSARESFDVLATELRQELDIGGLRIKTSVDRIDTLQDGSKAIIDYKTGAASLSSWFGEHPEEPQLPLYGVFGVEGVDSICFAQIKKGDTKYVGIANNSTHFSALKSLDQVKGGQVSWSAQLNYWRDVNVTLAQDFLTGRAAVEPTRKACDYCDLTSLCRIHEQQQIGLN